MTNRLEQLKEDLEKTKFNLTDEQKTILNHYIRTALTVIKLHIDSAEKLYCTYCESYMCECDTGYDINNSLIEREIDNIVKTLELINGN